MKDWYQIHLPYSYRQEANWKERPALRKAKIAQIPRAVYKKRYKTESAAKAALTRAGEDPAEWEICEAGYL